MTLGRSTRFLGTSPTFVTISRPAIDADEDLIHVPGVAGSQPPTAHPVGEVGAELAAPKADALAGDQDPTFSEGRFKISLGNR